MKAKSIIITFAALLTFNAATAQNQEATDSLTRELHEVVVNAKHHSTNLT